MYDEELFQLIIKLTKQSKLFARSHSVLHAARSSENQAIWQPVAQGHGVASSHAQITAVTGRITFASALVAMVSVLVHRVGVWSSSPLERICA